MKKNITYAMGQRISKTVTNKNTTDGTDKFVTTYYVRDPQGNVLAVYEHKHGDSDNGTFTLAEQHLYGAGRLGMKKRDLALNATNASESLATYYELTNHLGNVMAVISDETSTTAEPTIVSLSDYYPFGMTEPGRSWNSGDYRFGYTGHEKESDLAEGVYTTEYRLLDARLGRWLSVDPLAGNFAWMSPYNYCMLNPTQLYDLDGDEPCKGGKSNFRRALEKRKSHQIDFSFEDIGNSIASMVKSVTSKFKQRSRHGDEMKKPPVSKGADVEYGEWAIEIPSRFSSFWRDAFEFKNDQFMQDLSEQVNDFGVPAGQMSISITFTIDLSQKEKNDIESNVYEYMQSNGINADVEYNTIIDPNQSSIYNIDIIDNNGSRSSGRYIKKTKDDKQK